MNYLTSEGFSTNVIRVYRLEAHYANGILTISWHLVGKFTANVPDAIEYLDAITNEGMWLNDTIQATSNGDVIWAKHVC